MSVLVPYLPYCSSTFFKFFTKLNCIIAGDELTLTGERRYILYPLFYVLTLTSYQFDLRTSSTLQNKKRFTQHQCAANTEAMAHGLKAETN